jgi:iron complex transport system ATP-binding protein
VTDIPRRDLARMLAVVPQDTHLAFDYTVLEIALMGRYPHLGALEIEGPADVASALAALQATGTRPLADRMFHTLSGGEKQRVIIASALAQLDDGPDREADLPSYAGTRSAHRVLLLDEPTASLDLRYQIEVAALLRQLHDSHDITIVLSTHDLHFASAVCRDVVLLGEGRILATGPPRDVLTPATLEALYGIDVTPAFAGWR